MSDSELLEYMVVCDTPEGVRQCVVRLPAGATIADAIDVAHREMPHATIDWQGLATGIWGERRDRSTRLQAGDRVELYQPLLCDPKQARRARARRVPATPRPQR
jgi:putative ubiquitin-RnfH superfamily antitoxin RatB of RatAB toxin-antitoxin module